MPNAPESPRAIARVVGQWVSNPGVMELFQQKVREWSSGYQKDKEAWEELRGKGDISLEDFAKEPRLPIPFCLGRPLTLIERYVVLAAVHDLSRKDSWIDPWHDSGDDLDQWNASLPYALLKAAFQAPPPLVRNVENPLENGNSPLHNRNVLGALQGYLKNVKEIISELGVKFAEDDKPKANSSTVDNAIEIPSEYRSKPLTKAEIAHIHSGGKVSNPTAYIKSSGLILEGKPNGKIWIADIRQFPDSQHGKLLPEV